MGVPAILGRGDHEEEGRGLAVGGIVVHPIRYGDGRQARPPHRTALGVGHGDAIADGGAALFLSGQDVPFVLLRVGEIASLILEPHQQINGLLSVDGGGMEPDTLRPQKVCDAHTLHPFRFP